MTAPGSTTPRRRFLVRSAWTAVAAACSRPAPPPHAGTQTERRQSFRYAMAAAQVAELRLPNTEPRGVVVLVHGGFWKAGYDLTLEEALGTDLVDAGWAVWNVDYRAVGDGGGWPTTFADVAAGTDHLAVAARQFGLSLDRVIAVGHSAGGTLALWLAARPQLSSGVVGAGPVVQITAVVSQAGVNDLASGSRADLGDGAVDAVVGADPAKAPDRYAAVNPTQLLPLGVPVLAVSGAQDDVVPASQAREFAAAAEQAGDDVRLVVVPGEGHFEQLDPHSQVWAAVRTWLDQLP